MAVSAINSTNLPQKNRYLTDEMPSATIKRSDTKLRSLHDLCDLEIILIIIDYVESFLHGVYCVSIS
jgi:hypothetical protein